MSSHKDKQAKKSSSKVSDSSSAESSDSFDVSSVGSKIAKEIEGLSKQNGTPEENLQGYAENPSQTVGNLYVHSRKCLNCVHLAPTVGKKVYSDCHFSKGNDNCPASEVRIVIMLPYEVIATRLYKATVSGDAATLSSLSARLNRQDPDEIQKVLKRYRQMLAEASE